VTVATLTCVGAPNPSNADPPLPLDVRGIVSPSTTGELLDDTPAVTAMLDRLLHQGLVLKRGPKSG